MDYEALKLNNQLCFPLYACSREIIKLYKPFLEPLGLTYTQYITMMLLWENDNQRVKELGSRLFLDSGTLTPLLKKLEKQGFVTRKRSAGDERNVYIRLTDKGSELKNVAAGIPKKMAQCIELSKEDGEQLHRILHQILNKTCE